MTDVICRRPSQPSAELQASTLSPLLQRIYAARDIRSPAELETGLKRLLPPQQLKGLNEALDLLEQALEQQQTILIVGDFDADGATSTSVAVLALQALGCQQVDFLVPNRFDFGYGLSPEIVSVAEQLQPKPQLLVTVDNGISSIEGVAQAQRAGIKVLVTDHHLAGKELPQADAIVNPNQPGCEFPSKNLAGVGVIFYVMMALRSRLRQSSWFERQGMQEPNMAELLDLVALGTVADVVPLDHNNRILVQQGLQRIRSGGARPGIQALLEVAGRQADKISSVDMGFVLGPRLNAAGRLDDMSTGIHCLLSTNPGSARDFARQLDDFNRDRKLIEQGMQQEALNLLESTLLDEAELPWGLCLYNPEWHQGVIGILASRLKDKYHRPCIIFANADDQGKEIKGSARSIPGLHIRDALDVLASRYPGLLTKFGGHAMAAGMSFAQTDFERFALAFDEVVRELLNESDLTATVLSDGELQSAELNLENAVLLKGAGPWGQNFPEPVFDGVFFLQQHRIVGEKHLKMTLSVDPGGLNCVDAIAFNVDTQLWPNNKAKQVRVVYKLDANEFKGRTSLQFLVDKVEAIVS